MPLASTLFLWGYSSDRVTVNSQDIQYFMGQCILDWDSYDAVISLETGCAKSQFAYFDILADFIWL